MVGAEKTGQRASSSGHPLTSSHGSRLSMDKPDQSRGQGHRQRKLGRSLVFCSLTAPASQAQSPQHRRPRQGRHSPLLFEKVSLNPATLRKDPQPGHTQHQTSPCSAVPAPPRAQVGNSPHRGRRLWVSNSCFVFCGVFWSQQKL